MIVELPYVVAILAGLAVLYVWDTCAVIGEIEHEC